LGCRETALLAFYTPRYMNSNYRRITASAVEALPKARKTIWWLLKIILPTSLAVSLLQYFGVISWLSVWLTPVFSFIGLPGESSIVFISSLFLPLYAPIAIIATLPLSMREITILALMCLISHNMIVESAIQKKTGSSYLTMFLVRIFSSFTAAFLLNLMLPDKVGGNHVITEALVHADMWAMLWHWVKSAGSLTVKIVLIITALMMLQNILKEFKILDFLSKTFAPLMGIFGLSRNSSFLWFVGQILGLTYGSAVMIDQVEQKEISRKDANLLNYHIAINHSLLEDTLLFVAIGVPVLWITFPRIFLAMAVVWGVKLLFEKKRR
jgi:hypothetical protein